MFDELRINLILLLLNIVALGNFIYPSRNQFLIVLVLLMIFPLQYSTKSKMRMVTLLSLMASFMTNQTLCELCCVIALGLALNAAYELDLTEGPAMINTALGLSQMLSFWSHQYLQKNTINRDITLLIFTLPNLFLCLDCEISTSKVLYLINPIFDDKWPYSVGFVLGIYTTSLTSIEKHYKFFSIAIILLIEASLSSEIEVIGGILAFLRGLLVYTEQTHKSQMYFLLSFLFVKILFKQYLLYFMFIGYLIIGVILFQESRQKKQRKHGRKDESVGTQEILNDMYQMNQLKLK